MELERRLSRKRHTEEAFDRRKQKCDEEKERPLEAVDSVNISDSDVTSSFLNLKKSQRLVHPPKMPSSLSMCQEELLLYLKLLQLQTDINLPALL